MTFVFASEFDADERGHFGQFGGRYVPELLIPALGELEREYLAATLDPSFEAALDTLYRTYAGRPTPLYYAERLSRELGGARIYLKNEGLNHTGAHKISHCLGQILLAQRMGKTRIIAETGAGQHGLATATVAARFGLDCTVYMGAVDIERQRSNVFWMEQLGAKVVPVEEGTRTLKDAVNAALKDWIGSVENTYYLLGSALGPHPYPTMVRDFQSVVGREVRAQLAAAEARLPDYLIACVGGGSNAMGLFADFLEEPTVRMIGVEAGGEGIDRPGRHAVRFSGGEMGVIEGFKSYFLQDRVGNILPTHSISAGLDYPGIGPQLSYLYEAGRVHFTHATDAAALAAFQRLARTEGIIAALESCHAIAEAIRLASELDDGAVMVVNLSGRGDKDLFILAEQFGDERWREFLRRNADAPVGANGANGADDTGVSRSVGDTGDGLR